MSAAESDSRFCETCGAQLFPGSTFCRQCGMRIEEKLLKEIPQVKDNSEKYQIYQVYSIVNDFQYNGVYYDNLRINWFMKERENPLPFSFKEAIRDYIELPFMSRTSPENYLKERFTIKEVRMLKLYLNSVRKLNAYMEGCPLPISSDKKGYRDAAPPPGTAFIPLYKKSGYNLPFKVEGVFNTKLAEERIMGDDASVTIVSGLSVKDIQEQMKEIKKEKKKQQDDQD